MDDLPIQNIYQGFREKHSAFAKDVVGGPKEISVILRVVGLFGFVFFRSSFLCIRRRCLLHFIIFREETIFGGCRIRSEDGQTHSRASSGQLNVLDWVWQTGEEEDNFASKWFVSFSSLNCFMNYGGNRWCWSEVELDSMSVVRCGGVSSHPLHSSSFLATMRPLRWVASIWPSSILNSVNASSTSCCVNLSPQVISECLNLKWRDRNQYTIYI